MTTRPAGESLAYPLPSIDEQPALLDSMVSDSSATGKYAPGPYWKGKTSAAVREIKRHGLADFRGDTSGVGTSFADNAIVDIRPALGTSLRGLALQFVLERVWPFSLVMNSQVDLTRGWSQDALSLAGQSLRNSVETQDLLVRYSMPESRLGGCVATAEIGGEEIAIHYLVLLQLIDRVTKSVPISNARSLLEIGGGFGANVHLMVENFPNLRKIVYLDIPPNLYVGTCYLRALYGDAVRDFSATQSLSRIAFADDESLEIIAICPWQIEALDLEVDLFWNAHSFVEMPRNAVANYAARLLALPGSARTNIVLATYGGGIGGTLRPDELPTFFPGREFVKSEFLKVGTEDAEAIPSNRTFLYASEGTG